MVRRLFGKFIPGATLLHTLDLRIKLIGLCILVSAAVAANSWLDLGMLAVLVLVTNSVARMPITESFRDFWSLRMLYIVTVLLHSILASGEALIQLPLGLTVTFQGIERGIFFAVKIALMTAFIGPLLRTTHPSAFLRMFNLGGGKGIFNRMLAPLTLTLGIAMRFLPLILEEAERIRWSQVNRGLSFQGGIIKKTQSLIPLLTPLLTASLDRVDLLTTAMQSRGFSLAGKRTVYNVRQLLLRDYAALIVVIISVVITLV